MYRRHKIIALLLGLFAFVPTSQAQRYNLFSHELKTAFPSVVYDFLETYLFQLDSLEHKGENIRQQLLDDKVIFVKGTTSTIQKITTETPFEVASVDNKFYEVKWKDDTDNIILHIAFPMQYELLLGKPKIEIEKEFKTTLSTFNDYLPISSVANSLIPSADSCFMTAPIQSYYVESVNTATYYTKSETGDTIPTFSDKDKWHSAANLFQGLVKDIDDYTLYVEQNLYGFKKMQYTVPLKQWLAYCQSMKMKVYFAIEEEREDGLKALLIAQSTDLGFNHLLSVIIPDNFATNKKSVFKTTLNAYIPTQNVKDLYQKYVKKPKKRI